MNIELQDLAWSVLPKEFKKEVRNEYKYILSQAEWVVQAYLRGRLRMMRDLFGEHNLTSDAEIEEELLAAPRSKVTELYRKFKKDGSNACLYAAATLDVLFGSKCLPDEEPKSAELL